MAFDFAVSSQNAVDAVFAALGLDASYTAQGGQPQIVRVIVRHGVEPTPPNPYESRVAETRTTVAFKVSEVAQTRQGDSLSAAGTAYTLGKTLQNDGRVLTVAAREPLS